MIYPMCRASTRSSWVIPHELWQWCIVGITMYPLWYALNIVIVQIKPLDFFFERIRNMGDKSFISVASDALNIIKAAGFPLNKFLAFSFLWIQLSRWHTTPNVKAKSFWGPSLLNETVMLNPILFNKDFQTWLQIGWEQSRQPIGTHVRKSLLTNTDFNMIF